tara:strand:+ start:559 stop:1251 length:693 start_codon:yes stop_codon:yes gene_type:complete
MTKKFRINFIHGWGFDSSFWLPLVRELKKFNCFEFFVYNLGFIGKENLENKKKIFKKEIFIVHSVGFNWLIENIKKPDLVINFFGSPIFFDDFEKDKIEYRLYEKMLKNIKINEKKVLESFYINCGLKKSYNQKKIFDKSRLIFFLEKLQNDSLVEKTSKFKNKIFSIYSFADKILKKRDFKKYFTNKNHQNLKFIEKSSHAFPYLEPKKCKTLIIKIIDEQTKEDEKKS